jgi:hypothetical protein
MKRTILVTLSAAFAPAACGGGDNDTPALTPGPTIDVGRAEDEVQRALWRAARRGGSIGSPDFIRDTLRMYEVKRSI